MHTYRVFGLDVSVPRDVATLRSARVDADRHPDVHVTFAPVAQLPILETANDDLDVALDGDDLTIAVEDVGRFRVSGGTSIVVDPYPGVSVAEVDLYLAGSIMGAVLHQRGVLPLHCNAFACGDAAVLLCGDSGAGKSTLAAWFESRGRPLLTDDVCAVTFTADGQPLGHPGMPRLRLWSDALETMGRGDQASSSIPWAEGKFELEMASDRVRKPLPIAAIYHLQETRNDKFSIDRLKGLDAANAITSNIYRRRIADLVGQAPAYLKSAVQLAAQVPIFRVERTWGMEHFQREAVMIEQHANDICQAPECENSLSAPTQRDSY